MDHALRIFTLLAVAFAISLTLACAGKAADGSLRLDWRSPDAGQADAAVKTDPLTTTVNLTNASGATLRDVHLRVNPASLGATPAGLSIGTITDVPTGFEDNQPVWALGDLAAGARIAFRLGLWFSPEETAGRGALDLVVEASSPDLKAGMRSNALTFYLR